jgi:DNA-binding transcriptional ArsR family regulator
MFFTSADVARTRIAQRADPLWELVLAMHLLRRQSGDLLFTEWRRQAVHALRAAKLGAGLGLMMSLMPHFGYFPDFLNPLDALGGLEPGLEAICRTPKATLRRDLRQLACSRPLVPAARRLADGEPSALIELAGSMRTCYDLIVLPERHRMRAALNHHRQTLINTLATRGVAGMLGSLAPMATWSDGELRIAGHSDQELHLDGRGLLLIPSYFCIRSPITLFDPALPPVLVYPVRLRPDVLPGGGLKALAALVGATRAAVLDTIGTHTALTTTDLARHLGISAPSASEHATILRDAGLVTSHRDRNRMLHHLTQLGHALLDS